jgi:uncharacterized repeat protein (TIGR01451 family)
MSKLAKVTFKLLDLMVVFVMIFGSPMSALALVWTEPIDAAPGSMVTIHGDNSDEDNAHNFLPGEAVHVEVVGPNGGYTLACDATADENGAWQCDVTLSSDPAMAVGEYNYTATGLTSGNVEVGTFTDKVTISNDFSQASNGNPYTGNSEWIYGILNAEKTTYKEGMSSPQRLVIWDGPAASTTDTDGYRYYTFSLAFTQTTGKEVNYAYDFPTGSSTKSVLTQEIWGQAKADASFKGLPWSSLDPYGQLSGDALSAAQNLLGSGTRTQVAFPDAITGIPDPGGKFAGIVAAYESAYGDRLLDIYHDGDMSDVAFNTPYYDKDLVYYTFKFKVPADGTAPNQIFLAFGGHIAVGYDGSTIADDWGLGMGAGAIEGGPYHVRSESWNPGGNLGAKDNQIMAAAVIAPGLKSGYKFEDLDGDGTKDVGESGLSNWTIYATGIDYANQTINMSTTTDANGYYEFVLDPGTYTVYEDLKDGYEQKRPYTGMTLPSGYSLVTAPNGTLGYHFTMGEAENHLNNDFGNMPQTGTITVDKTGPEKSKVGDDAHYTVTITNTGPITLYRESIIDSVVGDLMTYAGVTSNTCAASIASGDSCTIEYDYTVQEGDADPLVNTVDVVYDSKSDLTGNEATGSSSWNVELFQPSVDIEKTGDEVGKVGDEVTYTYTIHNTSSDDAPNLILVSLVDDKIGDLTANATYDSGCDELTFDETCSFSVTWPIPSDADDPYTNTVEVHYNPDGFSNDITDSDSHSVELFQPAIELTKTGDALSKIGDAVDYVITLYNNSSADTPDLTCTVTDATVGVSETFSVASGANHVINVNDFVIPNDASDPFVNTASVTCSPEGFLNTYTDEASWSTNLFQPAIDLTKTGDAYSKVGDTVTYHVTITNTSSDDTPNMSLVSFTDSKVDDVTLPEACNDLGYGDSCTFTYTYKVLVSDDNGEPEPDATLVNTASVVYNPDGFPNQVTASDEHTVKLVHPDYTLTKSCETEWVIPGQLAVFKIEFANTGDVDLIVTASENLLDSNGAIVIATGTAFTLEEGTTETYYYQKAAPTLVTTVNKPTVSNSVSASAILPAMYGLSNVLERTSSAFCNVYAQKSGFKFHDRNVNGTWGSGEEALSGWKIYAFDTAWQLVDQQVTDSNGFYLFNLKPGTYTICEEQHANWFQSRPYAGAIPPGGKGTPVNDCPAGYSLWGWRITLVAGELDDQNNFGNYQNATKTGTKFHDLNTNGYWDEHSGETPLSGWTIVALQQVGETWNVIATTVTNANGFYSFSLKPGSYVICEQLQEGWLQSRPFNATVDPNQPTSYWAACPVGGYGPYGWRITLSSQQTDSGNNFGNYQLATKSGYKFEDLNANGIKDAGESGLENWIINANGTDGMGNVVTMSATTNASGYYEFKLKPGIYTITEEQQAGWTCSYPAGCQWNVTLISQQVDSGNNFGNWYPATKSGMKFEDEDADGIKDDGELGLSGWTIQAWQGATKVTETTTDSAGNYIISGLTPGTYTFKEVNQDGWTCSYPNPCEWTVTLTSHQVDEGNDFGNWYPATKKGMKFEDLDADGVKDAGESGLEGWTIYADLNDNSQLDANEPYDVTDASGIYEISSLTPGDYVFREVGQDGWTCSYPADCKYAVTLTSSDIDAGNNFGNWYPATKSGYKWNDLDRDGIWDKDRDNAEPALSGWTIEAWQGDVKVAATTTDADGYYEFTLKPGSYIIKEVCQPGWLQSYPQNNGTCGSGVYNITLRSRQVEEDNNFGNWKPQSEFTDTSFCPLPNDQFRLLYHLEVAPNIYRLQASNPGQFYYNVFFTGNVGDPVNLTITIPYPFVTQEGAGNPIQVHDDVSLYGNNCFVPSGNVPSTITTQALTPTSSAGNQIITPEDYTTKRLGQNTTVMINGTVPSSGLFYVTIHLDYGLKKTSGWKNLGTSTLNPVTNTSILDMQNLTGFGNDAVTIHGYEVYNFSWSDGTNTYTSTPSSYNEIKKFAGFMGIVSNSTTGNPVANAKVVIYDPYGKVLTTLYTDADGYYMFEYKHKAKSATYTVKMPNYGKSVSVTVKANGFAAIDFEVP